MSRATAENDKYIIAFGVDHTPMGCFFQVYEKAAVGENSEMDEMGIPQIEANESYGLTVHNKKTLERNPQLRRQIESIQGPNEKRYLRDPSRIDDIGRAIRLDITKQVYELWD